MTEDLINKKDIFFPSYLGTNDNLIKLLNRATQILCDWFSQAEKYGPLPFDENFKCLMPEEDGNSCLLYTSPSPRDWTISRMPSSA